jgi:hypothetical protein
MLKENKGPRFDDIAATTLNVKGRVAALAGKIGQPLFVLPHLRKRIAGSKIDLRLAVPVVGPGDKEFLEAWNRDSRRGFDCRG